jgi:hypothetical protein
MDRIAGAWMIAAAAAALAAAGCSSGPTAGGREIAGAEAPEPPTATPRPAGLSISGRILDEGGRGIGGATVRAYPRPHLEGLITIIGPPPDMNPRETVSALYGFYRIDGLRKTTYTVQAIAPGFSPSEKCEISPPEESLDFALSPGAIVRGAVVDAVTGGGIEGALVSAYKPADHAAFSLFIVSHQPPIETATTP